jgi:hypothetical protein
MKPKPTLNLKAKCACGGVSIRLTGKPLTMMLCACLDCQKATGTGHAALVLTRRKDMTITGETTAYAVRANSGSHAARHFCPRCGTPVYGQSARFPDLCLLPVGLFGATSWFKPASAIFCRSHNDWDTLPEIVKYNTYKDEEDA